MPWKVALPTALREAFEAAVMTHYRTLEGRSFVGTAVIDPFLAAPRGAGVAADM